MQINRLFEIVYILLDRKKVTANELAKRFEVSTRTIYRDIDTLSTTGIPVYMSKGKGGGISLLPDYILNKAVLTDTEKADILSSLKAVAAVSLDGDKTALKKVSSLLGEVGCDWIEVDFSSWVDRDEEKEFFSTIKKAIFERKVIQFIYVNGKGEKQERKVEPAKLCYKGQGWYVYGYCILRQDFRFFKLRRMKQLVVLDQTFLRKPIARILPENNIFSDNMYQLKLKFSSEVAFRVYDEFSDYQQLADGSFIVDTIYPEGEWFLSYILSFGKHCEVISPLEAREYLKEEICKLLKNYF